MTKSITILLTLLFSALTNTAPGQALPKDSSWKPWDFFLGTWQAVGEEFRNHPNANVDNHSFEFDAVNNQIIWNRHQSHFMYDGPVTVEDTQTIIRPIEGGQFEGILEGRESFQPFHGVDGVLREGGSKDIAGRFLIHFSSAGDSLFFQTEPEKDGSFEQQIFIKEDQDSFWLRRMTTNPSALVYPIQYFGVERIVRTTGESK